MICTRNGMLVYLVIEVVEGDPILGQQVVETLREVPHAQLVPAIRTTITNKINLLQMSVHGIAYKVKATVRPMSRSFKAIRIIPNSIATATISSIFINQSLEDTHVCKASVSITICYPNISHAHSTCILVNKHIIEG